MAPVCALAQVHYTRSLDIFREIDARLLQQAASFTGAFSPNDLAWLGPALLAQGAQQLEVVKKVRIVFGELASAFPRRVLPLIRLSPALYSFWLVVLVSFVDVAGILHLRSLGRTLRQLDSIKVDGQLERAERRRLRMFRQTYSVRLFAKVSLGSQITHTSRATGTCGHRCDLHPDLLCVPSHLASLKPKLTMTFCSQWAFWLSRSSSRSSLRRP